MSIRTILVLVSLGLLAVKVDAQTNYRLATPMPPTPGSVVMPTGNNVLAAPPLNPGVSVASLPAGIYSLEPTTITRTSRANPIAPTTGKGEPAPTSPRERIWLEFEFIYGVSQGVWTPPLLTSSPPGTPVFRAGALDQSTTTILAGNQRVNNNFVPGFKKAGGYWFDDDRTSGIDASVTMLGQANSSVAVQTLAGGNFLARPVVNGTTLTQSAYLFGGLTTGGATTSVDTSFITADINYRQNLFADCETRLDGQIGYRFAQVGDAVSIWNTGFATGAVPGVAGNVLSNDYFSTRNNFNGVQVGFALTREFGKKFSIEGYGKLAAGVTTSKATVDGSSSTPDGTIYGTGVLAGITNRTNTTSNYFGVIPEVGLKVEYRVWKELRLTAGYSFLYWNQVRRAPEQIDMTVLAPYHPGFRNVTTDYWVQGFTGGFQWRY